MVVHGGSPVAECVVIIVKILSLLLCHDLVLLHTLGLLQMSNTDTPEWEKSLSDISEWSLDNLLQEARQFLKHLEADDEVPKAPVIASIFLPSLFVRLIELLGLSFDQPKSPIDGEQALLFASLAKLLAPTMVQSEPNVLLGALASMLLPSSFPGGPIHILPLVGILKPDNDDQWSRVLDDESAQFLHSRATKLLDSVTEGTDEIAQLRLHEISNGHFPLGFNTAQEERWVLVDMRRALVPNQPLLQPTPQMVHYLKRAALEKLTVLSDASEEMSADLTLHLQQLQTMRTLDCSQTIPQPIL